MTHNTHQDAPSSGQPIIDEGSSMLTVQRQVRISAAKSLRAGSLSVATPLALALFAAAACHHEGSGEGNGSAALTLESETDLFPGFDYTTGLQPPDSPVQASFTLTAQGAASIRAEATASGSASSPTLTGLPGTGRLAIEGGFALIGELNVDINGLPSYEGPIPGLDNVHIPIAQTGTFDPFVIDTPTSVSADIPPSDLPGIPLPGGIPGQLVLSVAEGSFVELAFAGRCAGVEDGEAVFTGTLARSGTLVIVPRIEIDAPVLGTKIYDIPAFTLDLAAAIEVSDIAMTAPVESYGSKPSAGDHATGSCSLPTGVGGHGGAGSTGTSNGAGGMGGGGMGGGGMGGGGNAPSDPEEICMNGLDDDGDGFVDEDDCVP
jgi:hypothetical protein